MEDRLRVGASGSLWRAVDETLDRAVQVRLLDLAGARTADVMDAARRVTLAKDPRLAQIFDVGTDGQTAYIVIENLPGQALSQIVSGTPLPAAEARRLVGETAEALAGAAGRGLHHQRLTPEALIVGTDGAVKLTGTAVEAAAIGAESRNATTAARLDAVGLVCLLYAALTGRWPGTTPSALAPAPRVGGRPVPPVDLVPGVPSDLNQLCTTTLGDNAGPHDPAEVAQRLAPWAVAQPLTSPRGLLLNSPTTPRSTSTGARGTLTLPATPATSARAEVSPAVAHAAITRTLPATTVSATTLPAPTVSAPTVSAPTTGRTGQGSAGHLTTMPSPVAAPFPVVEHGGGSTGSDSGQAPRRGYDIPGSGWLPRRPLAGPPRPPAGPPSHPFEGWQDLSTIGVPVQDDEPLLPFVPALPLERPPRDQSRLAIVVVVTFVLVVVLVAAWSLRNFHSPGNLIPKDVTRPLPTATPDRPSASGGPAPTPNAPATSTPAAASPTASPQLVGAQAIDPQGDGSENNDRAQRAVDGDHGTVWKSNYYATADFAGLKKGLGLVVEVGSNGGAVPDVQQVTVDVAGSGGTVELRTTPGPGLDGSQVVATAPIESGQAVLTPPQPVNSRLLLLWFTKLPKTGGKYQLVVSEVNVR